MFQRLDLALGHQRVQLQGKAGRAGHVGHAGSAPPAAGPARHGPGWPRSPSSRPRQARGRLSPKPGDVRTTPFSTAPGCVVADRGSAAPAPPLQIRPASVQQRAHGVRASPRRGASVAVTAVRRPANAPAGTRTPQTVGAVWHGRIFRSGAALWIATGGAIRAYPLGPVRPQAKARRSAPFNRNVTSEPMAPPEILARHSRPATPAPQPCCEAAGLVALPTETVYGDGPRMPPATQPVAAILRGQGAARFPR